MAITKEKKAEMIEVYAEKIEKSSAIFLTDYKGISVNDLTGLRQKLREADGSYTVVKNTLARRTLDDAGLSTEEIEDTLSGPVGLSFCFGDPPPVAKTLVDFADNFEQFEIKGGLLGNTFLDQEAIKNLAKLPPLEVIRAQLLGVLSAPASQLVGVTASGVRQVVNVVDAYAKSEDDNDESD